MDRTSASAYVSSSDIVANVVRPFRKKTAVSISQAVQWLRCSPDSVNLDKASGGFNCVVEFDSKYCLRRFADGFLFPGDTISITPQQLVDFRSTVQAPFSNPALNTMAIDPADPWPYGIDISFTPTSIKFTDPHRVCVTYTGNLGLVHLEQWHRPPIIGPTDVQGPIGPEPGGPVTRVLTGLQSRSTEGSPVLRGSRQPSIFDPTLIGRISPKTDVNLYWAPVCDIGAFSLALCCSFDYDEDPDRTQVSVYALLSSATVEVQVTKGDVGLFYDQFVKPREKSLTSPAGPSHFPITPTISLMGKDPANISVPEVPNFDASVFYVDSTAPLRQALVAAFNLMEGCKGIVEDVQYFICNADYGVISDEFLTERVFMHKWANGAFSRTFPAQNTVQVQKNEQVEDATVFGTLHLDFLDWVSIECEANTGTDYVRLGGSATATATSIQLQDGTVLGPNDVDMGPPNQNPWSLYTNFDIDPAFSPDPDMRAFQIQAHNEAYQYCARPFSSAEMSQVIYSRTEGVLKRVFFLGTFPAIG